jgi:PhnB protein
MAFTPYLSFNGNAREAFTRYKEIFGGELVILTMADAPPDAGPPGADPNLVMHAALTVAAEAYVMGADDPTGSFDGNVNGMCVSWNTPDAAEAKRVFDALADGGEVQMPIGESFFSPAFGMCRDRFSVPWMILADAPQA